MEVEISYSNYKCMRIKKFMRELLKFLLNFFSFNKIKYEDDDGFIILYIRYSVIILLFSIKY